MSLPEATFRSEESLRDIDSVLRRLKQRGCTLLVTGDVPVPVSGLATRRLLGDPDCDRKRVLAFTDATVEHVDHCLPSGVARDDPDVWVVDPDAERRAIPDRATGVELPSRDAAQSDLSRLRQEIVQAVGFFDDATDGLDPAELRVGVAALDSLLAANGRPAAVRFLRAVVALVQGVGGMGHVRLPFPDDHDVVRGLSPLFDARIELRKRGQTPPEQRWHVPRHDLTTVWTGL